MKRASLMIVMLSGAASCVPMGPTRETTPIPTPFDPASAPPKVFVNYDEFKDITKVETSMVRIDGNQSFGTVQTAAFACKGHVEKCKPAAVSLAFTFTSTDWHFLTDHHVIVLADGQRLLPIDTGRAGAVMPNIDPEDVTPMTLETVGGDFAPGDFLKMAKATTVRVQVGSYAEFTLPAPAADALKLVGEKIQ